MNRAAITFACSVVVGAFATKRWPFPGDNALLGLIHYQQPHIWLALKYGWLVMLFTTPWLALSVAFSLAYIFERRGTKRVAPILPPYPAATDRLTVVLGELHHPTRPEPVQHPKWLVLPDRGLFTGIAIFGAIGSGKTSGCMRPYARQILSYQAKDTERKIGALVMEVKGDFCYQLRDDLQTAGRGADYMEIGMDSEYCYNPLFNDLSAFASAYGIAGLLVNLYGHGKEPFWSQAYTNLMKFIILLHKVIHGYVTLFNVYECAINRNKLEATIKYGNEVLEQLKAKGARKQYVVIEADTYLQYEAVSKIKWDTVAEEGALFGRMRAKWVE